MASSTPRKRPLPADVAEFTAKLSQSPHKQARLDLLRKEMDMGRFADNLLRLHSGDIAFEDILDGCFGVSWELIEFTV